MKKIRIGVMGVYRGTSMINYCKAAQNAEVVAVCDKWEEALEKHKEINREFQIAYYNRFEDFIQHDMDAVVLANYANEHAPFAIAAMKSGKHVFSEVLPVQTMKEAVELIDTVEETGMTYAYGENYCYMPAPYEMRKLYRAGKIGEFEYGECEYIHNTEPMAPATTYGDRNHWRNNMYSTFYCTHSIGPLIHITGLRPISVVGFEGTMNERNLRTGCKAGQFGIEMITLENGGIIKSVHGKLYKDSIWYSVYGGKGRMETAREDARADDIHRLYVNADAYSGEYKNNEPESYLPKRELDHLSTPFGHGGSDFYSMYHFVEKLRGNKEADTIDVYEALDMFLPGMFAWRSILQGGNKVIVPDIRKKEVRDLYREDTSCTDRKVAGDMLLPTFSKGTPEIDDSVYAYMRKKWQEDMNSESGYAAMAFSQGGR